MTSPWATAHVDVDLDWADVDRELVDRLRRSTGIAQRAAQTNFDRMQSGAARSFTGIGRSFDGQMAGAERRSSRAASTVNRELGRIRDVRVDITVDADRAVRDIARARAQMESGSARLTRGAASMAVSVGRLAGLAGTAAVAVGSLTPAAAAAGVAVGSLAGAAGGAAVAGVGALALVAGTAKVAMSGLGDAIAAASDPAKAAELAAAMEKLSPAAQSVVRGVSAIRAEWDRAGVQAAVQEAAFAGLGAQVGGLTGFIAPLRDAMVGVAEGFNRGARSALDFVNSARGISVVRGLLADSSRLGGNLSEALGNTLPGVLATLGSATGVFADRLDGAAAGATRLSERLIAAAADGSMDAWFDRQIDRAQQFGRVMGEAGSVVGGVFRAAAEAGGGDPFGGLYARLQQISAWVNGPDGQAAFTSFFESSQRAVGALIPVLTRAAGVIGGDVAPMIAELFERLGPAAERLIGNIGEAFQNLTPAIGPAGDAIADVADALGPILPHLGSMVGLVGQLAPLVSVLAEALGLIPSPLLAIGAAVVGLRAMPGILANSTGPLGMLATGFTRASSAATTARGAVASFADAYRTSLMYVRQGNPAISTMGAHMTVLGNNARAAGGAMGIASTAARGVGSAASGMVGMLGGPVGAAVTAATIGFTMWSEQLADNKAKAEAVTAATKSLEATQRSLGDSLRANYGLMTDQGWEAAGQSVTGYTDKLKAVGDQHHSLWESFKSGGFSIPLMIADQMLPLQDAADAAMEASEAFQKLGMTNEQVTRSMYGSAGQWQALRAQLEGLGEGGKRVASDMAGMRAKWEEQRAAASRLQPGVTELGEAMRILGDKSATAADRSKALTSALDAMNPARSKGEALARHNRLMRDLTSASQEAADASQGLGQQLLATDGTVDTTTANGDALSDSLMRITDASSEAATKGMFNAQMQERNANAFQQLATKYRLSIDEIKTAADKLGYDDIKLTVGMSGASDVMQGITKISQAWAETPDRKTIEVDAGSMTPATQAALEKLGFTVKQIPGTQNVAVTATTEGAQAKLMAVMQNAKVLDLLAVNPKIGMDDNVFSAKDGAVRAKLQELAAQTADPKADLLIESLLSGHSTSMAKLAELNSSVAKPLVDLLADQAIADANATKAAMDAIQDRTVTMTYVQRMVTEAGPPISGPGAPFTPPPRADGAIVPYVEGGIAAAESFANGGLKWIDKPTAAGLYAGRGAGTIFAERETGGEAYIPMALSKRPRSTALLVEVARRFGLQVVPAMAEGGLVGVDELAQFAQGVEGAPYVWGGVNWGDCSGAVSAIANYATGRDPFASRFATGSEAGELAARGFQSGLGPAGSLNIGWYNGGPGGGHTAATLPNGINFEMGGGRGNGQYGGTAAGANDPQFTDHAHLPPEHFGGLDAGAPTIGSAGTLDGTSGSGLSSSGLSSSGTSGSGSTSSTGGGSALSSGGGSGSTWSSMAGSAAGGVVEAAVSGQLAAALGIFGMDEQPHWVQAIGQLETQQPSQDTATRSDIRAAIRDLANSGVGNITVNVNGDRDGRQIAKDIDQERRRKMRRYVLT